MAVGEVKWFSRRRGFGFIRPEYGPCDVFVHVSAVEQAGLAGLEKGQRVEFELAQICGGRLSAFGLRLINQEHPPVDAANTGTDPTCQHSGAVLA